MYLILCQPQLVDDKKKIEKRNIDLNKKSG